MCKDKGGGCVRLTANAAYAVAAATALAGLTAGCGTAEPSSNGRTAATSTSASSQPAPAPVTTPDRPLIAAKDAKPGNGIWAVPQQFQPGVYLASVNPGELMGAVYLCKSIVECDGQSGGTIVLADKPQQFSIPVGAGGVMTIDVRLTPVAG